MRLTILLLAHIITADSYDEKLVIRPLRDETVLSQFSFSFVDQSGTSHHSRKYPRVFSEITSKLGVTELDLRLTRGWTDSVPLEGAAPNGAYLMATFDNENNIDEKWKTLIGQLAGLFCISLNQLDLKNSFTPQWLLPMYKPIEAQEKSRRRIGFLPREVACTENLVPWRKLLPTGDKHGLGALLTNPHHQLKKSSYWSISARFNSQSESGSSLVLEHSMIVDVRNRNTLDILTSFNSTDSEPKITINSRVLFGVTEAIPSKLVTSKINLLVCDSENIKIQFPKNIPFEKNNNFNRDQFGRNCQNYIFKSDTDKKIFFAFVTQFPQNPNGPLIESISSVRLLGGAGLDGKSKIISKILNTFDTEKEIISLEMIPWWINPKIGTIQFSNCYPVNKLYTPAQDKIRKAGSLLIHLKLEPLSTCFISYDYETRWPKWTEYPADSNAGRYLPSQLIFFDSDGLTNENEALSRLSFSNPLLVYIPIPDFSMPYNVLCLVSTVIAMCIGAIHNLTTSQLVDSSVAKPDTNLGKALAFIKSILIAIKTKLTKPKSDEPEVQPEVQSKLQPEVQPEVEDEANNDIRQRLNSSKAE